MKIPCLFIDNKIWIVDIYNIMSPDKVLKMLQDNYYVNATIKYINECEVI